MTPRPALLLVGHGSRSQAGVDDYWRFARVLQDEAPGLRIGCGFIELAEPDLDTAIDELVRAGADSVVAVPLVLLGAGHMKNDGPAALARGRAAYPHVGFSYARDLGIHPLVLSTAEDRIRTAVSDNRQRSSERSEPRTGPTWPEREKGWAAVVVSRGSSDPDANADLFKVSRLLWGSPALDLVEPAFVSLAPPSVTDALDRCYRLGARRIAVFPYFLFTGVLVERIRTQTRAWAERHPDVVVVDAPYLGPDIRIARLVLDRFEEAIKGDTRMNCDCCIYRVTLPGHAHTH